MLPLVSEIIYRLSYVNHALISPEDIVINCTRVIRRLTHISISSQTVFVISGMHYRAQ